MSGLAVKPISTQEAVVVSLRARILDGKIEPGVRLPELELAAELGVARPTVRAAIQTLCHEGLLVREPNRSAHIPVLTRDEILDLFSVRIPLECLVVRAVLERGAPLAPLLSRRHARRSRAWKPSRTTPAGARWWLRTGRSIRHS
jgi:DNA-binding GntR family transcriptional regulator